MEWSPSERERLRECATHDICRWLSTFDEEDVAMVLADVHTALGQPMPVTEKTKSWRRRSRGRGSQYSPEERAEILAYVETHSIAETTRKFGATRDSIYMWQGDAKRAALETSG